MINEFKISPDAFPIIFGIKSTALSQNEIDFFRDNPVCGFILFSRNIESQEQLINLNNSLRALYPERQVYIFVDQEGGRVARLKPPLASRFAPAEYFSKIYDFNQDKAKSLLYESYFEMMSEAKELGFDSICAPVLDIFREDSDNIIGDRSFGDNAAKVIDLATIAIKGIVDAGGLPFIKHMPGHGLASCDSHKDLPVVDKALDYLIQNDFLPFKELGKKFNTALSMTAHILYTELDRDNPATMSKKAIAYIRKNVIDNIIISDDISMGALHGDVGKEYEMLKDLYKKLDEYNNLNREKAFLLEQLDIKLDEAKSKFCDSLAIASSKAFDAGCDAIMHCSGDLDEMKSIINSMSKKYER